MLPKTFSNFSRSQNRCGSTNFNKLHNSPTLFCNGVPVNNKVFCFLNKESSLKSLPSQFFNLCASSTTTADHSILPSALLSKLTISYVVNTTSALDPGDGVFDCSSFGHKHFSRISKRAFALPLYATTFKCGIHVWHSRSQFVNVESGATTRVGRSERTCSQMTSKTLIACAVLPKPISSAKMHPGRPE